jgi:hypothetical protein
MESGNKSGDPMKGKGPKHERETIINFNEEDGTASIWTASETVYRRLLKRLGPQYLTEDEERHAIFVFPKNLLVLPRIKAKRTLDPDHRAKLVARMAESRKLLDEKRKNGHSVSES